MRLARSVPGAALILLLAGCGAAPGPSGAASASVGRPDSSDRPDRGAVVVDQLGGAWRSSPVVLDDAHVAIASDACAAKARDTLGHDDGDLPTALVDARGEHFVTVIMADDLNAIECLARLSDDGAIATVDSVDRLSARAVAPVEKSAITVASVTLQDDRTGGRTVTFGRIGSEPDAAKAGFGDNSTVLGSKAEGWWAMWWPGSVRANSFAATDRSDLAVGSAKPPAGEVEARVGPAAWWIDPRAAALTPASTDIHVIVLEESCASGDSPEGRVEQPAIELADTTVTVTYTIRRKIGGQDCPSNPPFAVGLKLPEPLGKRTLLDGGSDPARDASKPPPG